MLDRSQKPEVQWPQETTYTVFIKRTSKQFLCTKPKHGIPQEAQPSTAISFSESCSESLGNSRCFFILVQRFPTTQLV